MPVLGYFVRSIPQDRQRGVSAEALELPRGALLKNLRTPKPSSFVVVRLDVADGLGLDVGSDTRKPELQRSQGTTGVSTSALRYGVCWM
jgi:hypothetical protein